MIIFIKASALTAVRTVCKEFFIIVVIIYLNCIVRVKRCCKTLIKAAPPVRRDSDWLRVVLNS